MKLFFETVVRFLLLHPLRILLLFLLLTGVAILWLVGFTPLRLDTSFAALLPDDLPCVVESRRVSRLVGSTDFLYVAIESPNPADNIAIAEDIAARLEQLPFIEWVTAREDKSFFRRNRLLYLSTEDLREIVNRASARVDYEKVRANPFFVRIDDEPPPDIDFQDIMETYSDQLRRYGIRGILDEGDSSEAKDQGGPESIPGIADYIASPDGTLVTVMARPSRPAVDMTFGRMLVAETETIIAQANPRRNAEMKVEVAGSYRNRTLEYANTIRDIGTSMLTSVGLIVLIIILSFRRFRALVLILAPLLIGIVLSVALTALVLGRLNMVTALIFAVLLGLGIDFGVHLTTRYLDERASGKSLHVSLMTAFMKTGRAVLIAGLTTAGGLGVLIMARFKGFSEFGIIAMMGILLCLVTYVLLVPVLAVLLERISVPRPWRRPLVESTSSENRTGRIRTAYPVLGLILLFGMTLFLAYSARHVSFEYDFRNLGSRSKVSTDIKYGKTLSQSSSPVVAVLDTPEQARLLTRDLEARLDADGDGDALLRNVFSIYSFVPDAQAEKKVLLDELREIVEDALSIRRLKADTRRRLESILEWTGVDDVTPETLPDWVTGKFTQKDGVLGTMVYLFPAVNEYNVDHLSKFYDQFGLIQADGIGSVRPAASGFILVEVVRAVQQDGLWMAVGASIVVFLLLLIDFRSPWIALLNIVPLLVGLTWTAGIMGLFGIRVGLYNMLVVPLLLGIGIDASVHFYHSWKERGAGSLGRVFRTTGVAVLIAAVTTGAGFLGMMIVTHQGLRTIGVLAVVGLGTTLIGSILTMSLFLWLGEALRNRQISRD